MNTRTTQHRHVFRHVYFVVVLVDVVGVREDELVFVCAHDSRGLLPVSLAPHAAVVGETSVAELRRGRNVRLRSGGVRKRRPADHEAGIRCVVAAIVIHFSVAVPSCSADFS